MVSDNYVDKNLKEMLVYVYNRPQNSWPGLLPYEESELPAYKSSK